jgi:prevent-host-death family protein
MRTAAVSTLKAKLSEYLALVKGGEEVIVTDRGRPVAHIVPISKEVAEDERIARLVARGVLRPPTRAGRLRDLLKRIRPIPVSEGAVARAIREDRDEGG